MKKGFVLTAAVLAMTVLACGKKTDTAKSGGSSEPVTVKFANYALLEAGYTPFWEGVKAGFEKQYPHITIEWISAPYGEITNQVINMAGGGDKADMLFGEISWVPTLEDAGLAVPVDTILSASYLSDFYPNILDGFKISGKVYGIPLYISPYVLYYNKDIFKKAGLDPDKPPATYDEMLKMAEKIAPLKSDDGNKIYAFGQTTASVPVSGSSLTAMAYNFGGELLNTSGALSIDNDGFRQAFETLRDLYKKGYNPENARLKDLRNLFALGQLAMYYDQSWGFNGVQSINAGAVNFTASAPPLAGGKGKGDSILQAHCFILMDNGAAKREAVRLLVEYIITEKVLGDYMANITPAYPAKKSMSGMAAIASSNVLKGAAGSVEKAMPVPFIPAMDNLNLELCTLAQAVTVGGVEMNTAIGRFKSAAQGLLE
ncbi:MAG: extracellular solute-binding protein [Treponema sp.]|jgi:multiple sugar transport system substrate-binding protein|nr:extracellular solute-binding protein [Treponema sp.]